MSDYCPFRDAENRGFVVFQCELPYETNTIAVTDMSGRIWLEKDLFEREARAALAHELAHYDIEGGLEGRIGNGAGGHVGAVEAECNRLAAERLIDFEELVSAAKFCDSIEEMAEELNVDENLVRARIGALSSAEARSFEYQAGRIHCSMPRRSRLKSKTPLKRRTPLR